MMRAMVLDGPGRPLRPAELPVRTTVHAYPPALANEALADLRHGRFDGAAVLVP